MASGDIPEITVPDGKTTVLHTRVVTGTGGGPEKTILLSAPFLRDSDYWLLSAYMHPPEDPGFAAIRERAAAWESPIVEVPDRGPLDLSVYRRCLGLCRKYRVRIWHAHDYKSNFMGLLLRRFWPMKLVSTVHGWVVETARTPLYYRIDRFSLRRYDHVLCVSADLLETVARLEVPESRRSLVHNAIDERTFTRRSAAAAAPLREELGTPSGRLVIGAVGRLMPEKSFDLLVRATERLVREGLDVELWIAGEGPEGRALAELAGRLGVPDHVRLLGFRSDTRAVYEAFDVFALSSQREGLPNVVLEAAAMEVPIAATRVAGVPAMLTDGEDALLSDIGDLGGLTAILRRLILDAELRSKLSGAARRLIEARYGFARRMETVRGIYDQVLGHARETEATPPPALR